MMQPIDLKTNITTQLPEELVAFLQATGHDTAITGEPLYLVGGAVRDLFMGKSSFDLDLVTEGDAIALAQRLASTEGSPVTFHPRFQTARLLWRRWQIDIARTRSETYTYPGALPTVSPGGIETDLGRRDFTINAMAVALEPGRFGELLDCHRGLADLKQGLIRVLHPASFTDDATRIWRALRYEQRFGFHLEETTGLLLKQNIPRLDTISGDRIHYELECILKEEAPEKVLARAQELGVLAHLHPALHTGADLGGRFAAARASTAPQAPPENLYMALLTYPLSTREVEGLISFLHLRKNLARTLYDLALLRERQPNLARPEITPSQVYSELHGQAPEAIQALYLAAENPVARGNVRLYLDKLRYVKPSLTGDDLQKMGLAPGPRMKEILDELRLARLNGEINGRREEEILARRLLIG
jgi:tRNA nucleotidyltransferase (CCA-adding enzyme)